MSESKIAERKILTNWPKKAGLMWVDHPDEPLECDFCDNKRPLAHIDTLGRDVMCICKLCLQEIIDCFNDD